MTDLARVWRAFKYGPWQTLRCKLGHHTYMTVRCTHCWVENPAMSAELRAAFAHIRERILASAPVVPPTEGTSGD